MGKITLFIIVMIISSAMAAIFPSEYSSNKIKFASLQSILRQGQHLLSAFSRIYGSRGTNYVSQQIAQQITSSLPSNRKLVEQELHTYLSNKQPVSCQGQYDGVQGYQTQYGMIGGKQCDYNAWAFMKCTNQFLHVENKIGDIFPGSILKGEYFQQIINGGPQTSQVSVKPGYPLTNPTIGIFSSTSGSTYFTSNYDSASINKKISSTIVADSSPVIYFKIGSTDDLADFAQTLNFSPALFKKLNLNFNTWPSNLASYKKKYIMVFTKHIATYEVDIPDSPLNTFFTPEMTLAQYLNQQNQNNDWWDNYYHPAYVDVVSYGAMIILTVDYNTVTSNLYDQLSIGLQDSSQAQVILNQMLLQPSVNIFSRGPFGSGQLQAIRQSNWFDWMITIPPSIKDKNLYPLIYSVLDFNKRNYDSKLYFNYVKVCA